MRLLPNLTPLRFFLALLVILYHVPILCKNQGLPFYKDLPLFNRGTEAVYMFFILSGYLIIRLIYQKKKKHTFSIKNFYIRRILRIFPLYYLIALVGFVFYHLLLPLLNIPFQINYDLKAGVLLVVLFLSNVFTSYDPGGILTVLWSLSVEEQFYLFIAPLLYFCKFNKILKVLFFLFIAYFIIYHMPALKILMHNHFDYFYMLSGGVVAILEEKKKLNFLKNNKIWYYSIILLTLLFFSTNIFKTDIKFLYHFNICILFSFFLHAISTINSRFIIKSKLLNHLGEISYGIYMYHIIVLYFVLFIFSKLQTQIHPIIIILLINLSTVCLTIVVSHFSYIYFEKYFLNLKNKFR